MSTENTKSHDEVRIREAIDARADAIHNKDVPGVLSNFAKDSVVISFESVPMYMDGSLKAAINLKPQDENG